jgi:hypothetical protein
VPNDGFDAVLGNRFSDHAGSSGNLRRGAERSEAAGAQFRSTAAFRGEASRGCRGDLLAVSRCFASNHCFAFKKPLGGTRPQAGGPPRDANAAATGEFGRDAGVADEGGG